MSSTSIRQRILEYNAYQLAPGELLMTQRRLAQLVGVNEVTVHRHVTGQTSMSLAQAVAYARVLKCRVEDLWTDDEVA